MPMPSATECLCCQEVPQIQTILEDLNPESPPTCITLHPGFSSAVLDVWALQVAYLQYRQQYGALNIAQNEYVLTLFNHIIFTHIKYLLIQSYLIEVITETFYYVLDIGHIL